MRRVCVEKHILRWIWVSKIGVGGCAGADRGSDRTWLRKVGVHKGYNHFDVFGLSTVAVEYNRCTDQESAEKTHR